LFIFLFQNISSFDKKSPASRLEIYLIFISIIFYMEKIMKKLFLFLLLSAVATATIALPSSHSDKVFLIIGKDPITIGMFEEYLKKANLPKPATSQVTQEQMLAYVTIFAMNTISQKMKASMHPAVQKMYSYEFLVETLSEADLFINPTPLLIYLPMQGYCSNLFLQENAYYRSPLLAAKELQDFYNTYIKPMDPSNTLRFEENIGHIFIVWYHSIERKAGDLSDEFLRELYAKLIDNHRKIMRTTYRISGLGVDINSLINSVENNSVLSA
jgi:hypothetical protein